MKKWCVIFFLLKAERVHELNEEIGKLLAKVEQLGADGNVEESQKVMDEVEKARAKKREAEVNVYFILFLGRQDVTSDLLIHVLTNKLIHNMHVNGELGSL